MKVFDEIEKVVLRFNEDELEIVGIEDMKIIDSGYKETIIRLKTIQSLEEIREHYKKNDYLMVYVHGVIINEENEEEKVVIPYERNMEIRELELDKNSFELGVYTILIETVKYN